jgi:hypothetical protein
MFAAGDEVASVGLVAFADPPPALSCRRAPDGPGSTPPFAGKAMREKVLNAGDG